MDRLKDGKYTVLKARPCIFQAGNVTGWGSERVNTFATYADLVYDVTDTDC